MQMICAIITTSVKTHPHKRKITKLRFNKGFNQNYSVYNFDEFAGFNNHA